MSDPVDIIADALRLHAHSFGPGFRPGDSDPDYECPWEMDELDWSEWPATILAALAAAGYQLQPPTTTCPTCGSDNPAVQRVRGPGQRHCPDGWHNQGPA